PVSPSADAPRRRRSRALHARRLRDHADGSPEQPGVRGLGPRQRLGSDGRRQTEPHRVPREPVTCSPMRGARLAVVVAALGYFVDIYDLLLFGIVRKTSLIGIGV